MSKSIISEKKRCFVCGRCSGIERHHIMHGANRSNAEEDGLWVYLCADCHRGTEGVHGRDGHELDMELKTMAQERWEQKYGSREDFVHRYGKSFI